jgi:hypothetical protein
MRYIKRQTLDRRTANNTSLYSDPARANVYVSPIGAGSLVLPNGTNAQRPGTPSNGMMRYNTDAVTGGQLEVYSAGRWRALRFAEQKQITQQNLGAGDGTNTFFGPLNATYYNPGNNANNATVGAQNILVIVENVIQVSAINYTITNNPTLPAETYTPKLSFAAVSGSTTLYFNTSLFVTGASGNGSTATLTFATQTQIPFAIGASIIVFGVNSTGGVGNYNGTFTVTGSTTSSVSWSSATTATYQNGGEIDAVGAVYPTVNLVGATISGTNLAGSTISAYAIDPNTDALLSVTFSPATTTSTVAVNTTYTITKSSGAGSGYYLNFSTPVPYGKVVVALLGFDS